MPNSIHTISNNQISQSRVIDATDADDNEVILISAMTLSDTACNLSGAADTLLDIARLLHLIQSGDANTAQSKALARLACDTTNSWVDVLKRQVDVLNKPLSYSKFGVVEVNV